MGSHSDGSRDFNEGNSYKHGFRVRESPGVWVSPDTSDNGKSLPLLVLKARGEELALQEAREQELWKMDVLTGARVTEGQGHCQKTELRERRAWKEMPLCLSF